MSEQSVIKKLRDLGFKIEWSQGATPEDEKQRQRDNGWLWEGDDIPDEHPKHLILKDDSDDPNIWALTSPGGIFLGTVTGEQALQDYFESLGQRDEWEQKPDETTEEMLDRHHKLRRAEGEDIAS